MASDRVVIVGGGIIGTLHAREALVRGWEVVHLETDQEPRRASVRNFGLVWVSGRAGGLELDTAIRARELWEKLAVDAPDIGFRPSGSVTVAREPAELALLTEAAGRTDATRRGFQLLDEAEVRRRNPAIRGEVAGGLFCGLDAVIEPGSVVVALRARLSTSGHYLWLPGHRAVDVLPDAGGAGGGATVVDHRGGHHRGSLVLLCIGDRHTDLGGRVGQTLATAPLARCRLQMMQTAPTSELLAAPIADGDSLRYYPAFDLPGRSALPTPPPETKQWGMQLLMVQRAGGELTIGDTHVYQEPFDFAVGEIAYDLLLARAESILGWELPPVVRRWSGTYSLTTDDRIEYRHEVDPGVWVVTGLAGRGMTLSPAIAERTWAEVGL